MISAYGANLLTDVFTGQATFPATLYIALLTGEPDINYTGTQLNALEPSGGDYARVSIAMSSAQWTAAAEGQSTNINGISFPLASADWGFITHYAYCTSATTGYWIWSDVLSTPGQIGDGYQFYIPPGGASILVSGA